MRFPARSARTPGSLLLPNTSFDYLRAVGDGRSSTVIMAVAHWIARTFPEAPARVQQVNAEGIAKLLLGHPCQQLLDRPNPYYSGINLWNATLLDLVVDGNAYWLKARSALGRPVELWYVPSWMIEPKFPDDGSAFLTHYDYTPDPGKKAIQVPPEDVVHIRQGIDRSNTRKGCSPLKALAREVFTDDEAANFTASLLRNLGIPGVIISPSDPEGEASADDQQEVKEAFMRRFGGDRRGEPLILRTKTDVKVLSFSPSELNLKELRRIPEERVTALLGVPAIVVGLGAGLEASTFANYAEAREAAWESNIAPLQRLVAAELTRGLLLADFTGDATTEIFFDIRQVRVMQEDINKRSKRMTEEFDGGLITRAEARAELGKSYTDADKVYRIHTNMIEVPADQGAEPLTDDILGSGQSAFGSTPAKPKPKGGDNA